MNLILLEDHDFTAPDRVRLSDRRADHIRTVHRAQVGDELKVGVVGGKMGQGLVTKLDESGVELTVRLSLAPPAPAPIQLFLALPRPKFLAKCLQTASSLGIKRIYLINSYRVEKVYWSCQQIQPFEIKSACLLGLEQARDTELPEVILKPRFKPFFEDEVPTLIQGTRALVAHPVADVECPRGPAREPISLAIGPEGGFIDYEIELMRRVGLTPVGLGERILKVETAIATLAGRLC